MGTNGFSMDADQPADHYKGSGQAAPQGQSQAPAQAPAQAPLQQPAPMQQQQPQAPQQQQGQNNAFSATGLLTTPLDQQGQQQGQQQQQQGQQQQQNVDPQYQQFLQWQAQQNGQQQQQQQPQQQQPQQGQQQQQQQQQQRWYGDLPDELNQYMETKNFKNVEALVRSYQSLEQIQGAPREEIYRVRPDMSPEERGNVYKALGRPESADQYSVKANEGDVPELVDWFKGAAFESGLSDQAANDLYHKFNEQVGQVVNQQNQSINAKNQQEMEALQRSWGTRAQYNQSLIDRAALANNVPNELITAARDAGQSAALCNMLLALGDSMAEGSLKGGQGSQMMGKSVSQAQQELSAKMGDAQFKASYFDKSSPNHANAVREVEELNKIIVSANKKRI